MLEKNLYNENIPRPIKPIPAMGTKTPVIAEISPATPTTAPVPNITMPAFFCVLDNVSPIPIAAQMPAPMRTTGAPNAEIMINPSPADAVHQLFGHFRACRQFTHNFLQPTKYCFKASHGRTCPIISISCLGPGFFLQYSQAAGIVHYNLDGPCAPFNILGPSKNP